MATLQGDALDFMAHFSIADKGNLHRNVYLLGPKIHKIYCGRAKYMYLCGRTQVR
ncbi:MAG: hypothetical protein BWY72_01887 [Bacteroidetes bacterium ADurb.Bin416]|nr:MAG: hypothetical protein BWY72_01887 [Bacteroidetes bacterium ADurb.Bin416]